MRLNKKAVVCRNMHYRPFILLKSLLDLLAEGVGGGVLVERKADDILEEFFG